MTKKALIGAMALVLGWAGQVAIANAAAVCPVRTQGEADAAYSGRTTDYCEARWSERLAHNHTGGEAHEAFIARCSAKCGGAVAGNNQTLVVGGVLLAAAAIGGIAAAVSSGHHDQPASP